jgi:hypothetical protein
MDEALAEVWIDDGHRIVCRLVEWRGHVRFDIRMHFRIGQQWLPTRRGVVVPITELDAVRAAVETAMAITGIEVVAGEPVEPPE